MVSVVTVMTTASVDGLYNQDVFCLFLLHCKLSLHMDVF